MKTFNIKPLLITALFFILSCKGKDNEVNIERQLQPAHKAPTLIKSEGANQTMKDSVGDADALKIVYGNYDAKSKSAKWKIKNKINNLDYQGKGTLLSSIISSKEFSLGTFTKKIFITKTISDADDLNPVIGILEFTRSIDKWEITLNNYFFQSNTLSAVPLIKLELIGKNDYGIFLNNVTVLEGIISKNFMVFIKSDNDLKKVLSFDQFSENNSGICDETLNNCYSYKTTYELIDNANKLFDIRLLTKGTHLNNDKLEEVKITSVYVFDSKNITYNKTSK